MLIKVQHVVQQQQQCCVADLQPQQQLQHLSFMLGTETLLYMLAACIARLLFRHAWLQHTIGRTSSSLLLHCKARPSLESHSSGF
jgi:hypothetical protein